MFYPILSYSIFYSIILGRPYHTSNNKKWEVKIKRRKLMYISVVFLYGIPWRKYGGEDKVSNSVYNIVMNKRMGKEAIFQFLLFSVAADICTGSSHMPN